MAQVLWREAYLKRQKRKGRDMRGKEQAEMERELPPLPAATYGRHVRPFGHPAEMTLSMRAQVSQP